MRPKTRYPRSDGGAVAYQVTGEGPDLTYIPNRIRCAAAIAREVRSLGIEVKTGLHTEEVELRHDDIGGIAG